MKTTMFDILKERLEEEKIIKLVSNYDNKFCELEEENKRLNNIIDELEKWLEYQADHTMQQHNYYSVLDKLKELKGSMNK